MKCPLLAFGWIEEIRERKKDYGECLKDECAWWLEDIGMCSIRDMAIEMRYTQLRLTDVLAKIPKEYQFKER